MAVSSDKMVEIFIGYMNGLKTDESLEANIRAFGAGKGLVKVEKKQKKTHGFASYSCHNEARQAIGILSNHFKKVAISQRSLNNGNGKRKGKGKQKNGNQQTKNRKKKRNENLNQSNNTYNNDYGFVDWGNGNSNSNVNPWKPLNSVSKNNGSQHNIPVRRKAPINKPQTNLGFGRVDSRVHGKINLEWEMDYNMDAKYHSERGSECRSERVRSSEYNSEYNANFECKQNEAQHGTSNSCSRTSSSSIVSTITKCNENDGKWWFYPSDDASNCYQRCSTAINDKLNNLNVFEQCTYNIGHNHYRTQKLSGNEATQTNIQTQKCRKLKYQTISSTENDSNKNVWYFENGYENGNVKFEQCDSGLQLLFTNLKIGNSLHYKIGHWKYTSKKVSNDTITQTNDETKKVRMLIYSNSKTLNNQNDLLTKPESEESKMRSLFHKTMSNNDYQIKSIEKVKFDTSTKKTQLNMYNQLLKDKKQAIINDISKKSNKIERYLFHGTSYDIIAKIVQNGFNRDFNQNAVYGKGVYFAKNASYSNGYCSVNDKNEYHMLICRVIVGDYCKGSSDMTTIPFKNDGITQYDSLVDNINHPTIFVISRDYHCIPYYMVKYTKLSNNNNNVGFGTHRLSYSHSGYSSNNSVPNSTRSNTLSSLSSNSNSRRNMYSISNSQSYNNSFSYANSRSSSSSSSTNNNINGGFTRSTSLSGNNNTNRSSNSSSFYGAGYQITDQNQRIYSNTIASASIPSSKPKSKTNCIVM